MKKTCRELICIGLVISTFTLTGCGAQLVAKGIEGLATVASSGIKSGAPNPFKDSKLVEQYSINGKSVRLYEGATSSTGAKGYMFSSQGKFIFYNFADESDMKKIDEYKAMILVEKKTFIREKFLKFTGIDLGPVEVASSDSEDSGSRSSKKGHFSFPSLIPTAGFTN